MDLIKDALFLAGVSVMIYGAYLIDVSFAVMMAGAFVATVAVKLK